MASDRLLDTIAQIQQISKPYASQVTKLSNLIESLDAALTSLDAKIDVEVYNSDTKDPFIVAFKRDRNGWALCAGPNPSSCVRLTSATLNYKVRAAPLLQELLDRLLKAYQDGLTYIQNNTAHLAPVMDRIASISKEGNK